MGTDTPSSPRSQSSLKRSEIENLKASSLDLIDNEKVAYFFTNYNEIRSYLSEMDFKDLYAKILLRCLSLDTSIEGIFMDYTFHESFDPDVHTIILNICLNNENLIFNNMYKLFKLLRFLRTEDAVRIQIVEKILAHENIKYTFDMYNIFQELYLSGNVDIQYKILDKLIGSEHEFSVLENYYIKLPALRIYNNIKLYLIKYYLKRNFLGALSLLNSNNFYKPYVFDNSYQTAVVNEILTYLESNTPSEDELSLTITIFETLNFIKQDKEVQQRTARIFQELITKTNTLVFSSCFIRLSKLLDSEDIKRLAIELIQSGYGSLVISYFEIFINGKDVRNAETQIQLITSFIENGQANLLMFSYFIFDQVAKDKIFDLIKSMGKSSAEIERVENLSQADLIIELIYNNSQLNNFYNLLRRYLPGIIPKDSESIYLILLELINKIKIPKNFITDFKTLLGKLDNKQLLEIALKLIQGDAGDQIFMYFNMFLKEKEKQYKIRIILELFKFKRADHIINNLEMFSDSLDLIACLYIINPELICSSFERSVVNLRVSAMVNNLINKVYGFLKAINATPTQKLTIVNALYEALCVIESSTTS